MIKGERYPSSDIDLKQQILESGFNGQEINEITDFLTTEDGLTVDTANLKEILYLVIAGEETAAKLSLYEKYPNPEDRLNFLKSIAGTLFKNRETREKIYQEILFLLDPQEATMFAMDKYLHPQDKDIDSRQLDKKEGLPALDQ